MRKTLVRLLIFVMIATIIPINAFAVVGDDIKNHWAKPYVEYLHEKKVILPAGGNFKPDQKIFRAELMRYINRALSFTETANINFSDIKESAKTKEWPWYYEDVRIAVKHRYIEGTGQNKMTPLGYLNREQVATIIGRLHKSEPVTRDNLKFVDKNAISAWSYPYISNAIENKYIVGYTDNTFKPANNITRAEVAKILYVFCGTMLNTSGVYRGSDIKTDVSNVTISANNIVLENATIQGNLYITEGVLSGKVTLNNVDINGEIIVGGGVVNLNNVTASKAIISSGTGREVIVNTSGDTNISIAEVKTNATLSENDLSSMAGGFIDVIVNGKDDVVCNLDGSFLNVAGASGGIINLANLTNVMEMSITSPMTIKGLGSAEIVKIYAQNTIVSCDVRNYELGAGIKATINGQAVKSNLETMLLSPDKVMFDKNPESANCKDISVDLLDNNYKVSKIKIGEFSLLPNNHYKVRGTTAFTIKKDFLVGFVEGTHEILFKLNDGSTQRIKLTVADSSKTTLSAYEVTFDKYAKSENYKDIVITVYPSYGNTIRNLTYGGSNIMMPGNDYILNGNQITLTRQFLSNCSNESFGVDVVMVSGNNPRVNLIIKDTSPKNAISPTKEVFDSTSTSVDCKDVIFKLIPAEGAKIKDITHNGASLIPGRDYSYDKGAKKLTIYKRYLLSFPDLNYAKLIINMDTGTDLLVTIDYVKTNTLTLGIVNSAGKGVSNVKVTVGQQVKTTDFQGKVKFGVKSGNYDVDVSPSDNGYAAVSKNIFVPDHSTELTIDLKSMCAVSIIATDDKGAPIKGAQVTLSGKSMHTGNDGIARFAIEQGSYDLSMYHDKKGKYNGKITVQSSMSKRVTLSSRACTQVYGVTISVRNSAGIAVKNAQVTIDGKMQYTSDNGATVFYLPRGDYDVSAKSISGVGTNSIAVEYGSMYVIVIVR